MFHLFCSNKLKTKAVYKKPIVNVSLSLRDSHLAACFCLPAAFSSGDKKVVDLENEPTAAVRGSWSCDDCIHVALAVFHSKADSKQEGRKSANENID